MWSKGSEIPFGAQGVSKGVPCIRSVGQMSDRSYLVIYNFRKKLRKLSIFGQLRFENSIGFQSTESGLLTDNLT